MPERMLTEPEGYDMLDSCGIPVPPNQVVASADDARAAAERIGYPVVMKVVSPQIIHKSDVGGVITGIGGPDEAEAAYNTIVRNAAARAPEATITGIIVEKQMPGGLEVLIGGKSDPSFGKVITFGLGGRLVELLQDVSIRVLPVTEDDIRAMIREIEGYRLIRGYRGEPPKDEGALIRAIGKMARHFAEDPGLREFDLNPVIVYERGVSVVDARIIVDDAPRVGAARLSIRAPPEIFYPDSIAVIGASASPNKVGYSVLRNLLSFPGSLYPVNPTRTELFGRKVYPSVAEIPGPVDWAVIAVPARLVPEVMEECGEKGVRLAVIVTAGFREIGGDGAVLEERVVEIARRHGIRITGPNCLGIMMPHQGINATFDPVSPRAGDVAFVSQSGAIITTVVDWSLPEEFGFSSVISVGNQADLGFEHYLRFAEQDPTTRSVTLYIEEIQDGRGFMHIVRQVADRKPVVAVKSGSSRKGRAAASSHTGSLAGSYDVYVAAFRQAGVIPVQTLRDAFNLAELLASEGYPRGNRAIAVTSAGGFAVLASDYAETYGIDMVDLPEDVFRELNAFLPSCWNHANPMDIIGDADAARFAALFDVLIRHQDFWDIAFVIAVPTTLADPAHIANEIVRFSRNTDKMVVGCMLGGDSIRSGLRILRSCRIPNFSELEDAFKAAGSILRVRTARPGEQPRPPAFDRCPGGGR
ncbi:acetate--CoA ligase family protein [Methanoculleus sp. 7T]|uniref:acetate--CoA ligase family protein n=1 Tax=Methanoculleus sp. 7T TaxID=2937282 RepID=UPI0020BF2CCB|nr:acetate--CoA ligase family protein [Methanoculleus sp. 7T]MCK8518677.1 acetate--CoA ligase family protein [Methanoculleus sp. 7T]